MSKWTRVKDTTFGKFVRKWAILGDAINWEITHIFIPDKIITYIKDSPFLQRLGDLVFDSGEAIMVAEFFYLFLSDDEEALHRWEKICEWSAFGFAVKDLAKLGIKEVSRIILGPIWGNCREQQNIKNLVDKYEEHVDNSEVTEDTALWG